MAYKEVSRVEIAEVIRRWQSGSSQRYIASGIGLSRDTVRKYLVAARKVGGTPGGAGSHRGTAQPAGVGRPLRPEAGTRTHR